MDAICEVCGDIGFPEALIYCDKCQIAAEHRYCLEKLPATFTEYVTWFCEHCAPKVAKPSPVKKIPAPSRKSDRLANSAKLNLGSKPVQRIEARTTLKRKNISESATRTEMRKHESSHLQPCEAHGTVNHERDQKLEKERRLIDNTNTDKNAESCKLLQDQNCEEAESTKISNYQGLGEAGSSKSEPNQKLEESESSKISNDLKLVVVESNKVNENQKLDEAEISKISVDLKLENHRASMLEDKGNTGQDAESSKINTHDDPQNTSEPNFGVPAEPIIFPVWRGRFSICDSKFSSMDGLAAHLSANACLKVSEEARLLPESLFSDMLPRDDVWPNSFKSSEPTEDNIALYFFPEHEKDERDFDSLVEYMIGEDLAMRAVVVNAELLVFTSIQLPLAYWRFQAKYYLWGVFRKKQPLISQQQEGHLMIHNSSNESAVTAVTIAEDRDLSKTLPLDRRSPVSPLSNGSYSADISGDNERLIECQIEH